MSEKRYNRAQVEWMPILGAYGFCILDMMLFQSNLTKANDGIGWKFHIRQLAKDTGVSKSYISDVIKKWPFIIKTGTTKDMLIQLDYPKFQQWIGEVIVRHTDNNEQGLSATAPNDCPPHGQSAPMIVRHSAPISSTRNKEELEVIGNLEVQPKVDGAEQLTCSQNEPLNDGTCSQNEPLNEADLLKKWKRPAQKEGVQEVVVVKEVVSKSTRNSGKTFGLSDEVIGNFGLTDEEIGAQQNRKTMEIRNNLGAAGKDFMYDRESAINDLKIQKQQLDALNQLKRK